MQSPGPTSASSGSRSTRPEPRGPPSVRDRTSGARRRRADQRATRALGRPGSDVGVHLAGVPELQLEGATERGHRLPVAVQSLQDDRRAVVEQLRDPGGVRHAGYGLGSGPPRPRVRGLRDLFSGLHQAERRGAWRRGGEDAVDVVERQEILEPVRIRRRVHVRPDAPRRGEERLGVAGTPAERIDRTISVRPDGLGGTEMYVGAGVAVPVRAVGGVAVGAVGAVGILPVGAIRVQLSSASVPSPSVPSASSVSSCNATFVVPSPGKIVRISSSESVPCVVSSMARPFARRSSRSASGGSRQR